MKRVCLSCLVSYLYLDGVRCTNYCMVLVKSSV